MLEKPPGSFSSTGPYLTFNFLAYVQILLNRLCFFIKVNYIWLQLWAGHCWNPEGLTDCQVEYVCAISKSTKSSCIFKAFVMFCFTKKGWSYQAFEIVNDVALSLSVVALLRHNLKTNQLNNVNWKKLY